VPEIRTKNTPAITPPTNKPREIMKIPKQSNAAFVIRTLAGLSADNLKSQRNNQGHPLALFFEGKAQAFGLAAKLVAKQTTWKPNQPNL